MKPFVGFAFHSDAAQFCRSIEIENLRAKHAVRTILERAIQNFGGTDNNTRLQEIYDVVSKFMKQRSQRCGIDPEDSRTQFANAPHLFFHRKAERDDIAVKEAQFLQDSPLLRRLRTQHHQAIIPPISYVQERAKLQLPANP